MKVNMKKIAFVCAFIGASSTAVAAEFTEQNTAEADIAITRPVSATQIAITPVNGLTTTDIVENTILATVRASTTVDSNNQVAIRWSKNIDTTSEYTATIYESANPEYKLRMSIKEKEPNIRFGLEADDMGEAWLVGSNTGLLEANIVAEGNGSDVYPGTYRVSLDSAIYNP
uniref:Uncharacterized protein n=1 Tax=Enterobacter cloacae TaxID=550 RepID=A0A1S6XY58_ENTCL|nr:hypothetical protein [Enterobacter cloacae]AQX35360.1 hypothetical protein PIMI5_00043 [Enterobacter cloacae]